MLCWQSPTWLNADLDYSNVSSMSNSGSKLDSGFSKKIHWERAEQQSKIGVWLPQRWLMITLLHIPLGPLLSLHSGTEHISLWCIVIVSHFCISVMVLGSHLSLHHIVIVTCFFRFEFGSQYCGLASCCMAKLIHCNTMTMTPQMMSATPGHSCMSALWLVHVAHCQGHLSWATDNP